MKIDINGDAAFVYTGRQAFDAAKPCVMFVHGAGLDHTVWTLPSRYFIRHGYNVLNVDLPGHGRSGGNPKTSISDNADWLVNVLDTVGASETAIAGHSMGSLISIDACSRYQNRFRALALLGTGVPMPVAPPLQAAADVNDHAAIDMLTLWGYSKSAQIGGNETPGMWMVGTTLRLFENSGPGVIAQDLAACNAFTDGLERAGRIVCPTLLILGSQDIMTPPMRGKDVADAINGSRTVVLNGSGHTMMSEQPDAVLDALISIV